MNLECLKRGFMRTSTGHREAVVKRFTAKDVEVEQLEQWGSIGSPPGTRPPVGLVSFWHLWSSLYIVYIHPGYSSFFFNVVLNIHPGVGHTAHKPFQVVNARAGIQDILQKKDAEEAPCQMGLPGAVESMPKLVPRDTGLLQPIIVNCSYQQKDWELLHIVTLFSMHFPLVFWVVEKGGHLRWRRHRSIDLPFPASF